MLAFQHPDFGLGNFINTTPTIKRLSELNSKPIDTYFASTFVKECFIDCPFINCVDYPTPPLAVSSGLVNKGNISSLGPDYQFVYKTIIEEEWDSKYHTYVDSPNEYDFSSKGDYLVIINGCAGGAWAGQKEIPQHTHKFIKQNTNLPMYYIGSTKDLENNSPWMKNLADVIELDNIRKCLALIRDSKKIITNDTGLAHAAGALNADMLILWRDTPFLKNHNPGTNTVYAQKHEWEEKIIEYLKE